MQYIEIAYVSSIREVSIVFATIIGMIFLFPKTKIYQGISMSQVLVSFALMNL